MVAKIGGSSGMVKCKTLFIHEDLIFMLIREGIWTSK